MPKVEIPADQVFAVLKENILVDGFHVVIDLEKSHGAVIVDALEGKEYLDCYGYFATLPVGHNHPKLADEGFRESLMTAALANPSNSAPQRPPGGREDDPVVHVAGDDDGNNRPSDQSGQCKNFEPRNFFRHWQVPKCWHRNLNAT